MSYPGMIYDGTGESVDIGLRGGTLAGTGNAEATYKTRVGQPDKEVSLFTFPGTSLVFAHQLGMRTRIIDFWGDVRASEAGLVTLMQSRDRLCSLPSTFTFVDDSGLYYLGCLLKSFEFGPKTRIQDRGLLRWLLPYRIQLEQLEP